MFSDTFAGIGPSSAPAFIAAQLVGALLGAGLVLLLHPEPAGAADQVVVLDRLAADLARPFAGTQHFAGDRLTALAQAQGAIVSDVPEVLFVCVHNAGRSQMAAALLDHHARGRVNVRSAGSAPASAINPTVRAAMDEIGIDLSKAFPKPLTDDVVRAADVVITMGCGDACPVYPGKRYLDWELTDPAGKGVDAVRPIRDDIDARVRALLTELGVTPSVATVQGPGR